MSGIFLLVSSDNFFFVCFYSEGIIRSHFHIIYVIKMILCAFRFKSLCLCLHQHSRVLNTQVQMSHTFSWEESFFSTKQKMSVLDFFQVKANVHVQSYTNDFYFITFLNYFLKVCKNMMFSLNYKRVLYSSKLLDNRQILLLRL